MPAPGTCRRRARCYNVVDLVNHLDAEARAGDQGGRTANQLCRRDLVIFDELGYLPFAQTGGQLLFHVVSKLYEVTSIAISPRTCPSEIGRPCSAIRR